MIGENVVKNLSGHRHAESVSSVHAQSDHMATRKTIPLGEAHSTAKRIAHTSAGDQSGNNNDPATFWNDPTKAPGCRYTSFAIGSPPPLSNEYDK
jgi:hypothetical protein